MNKEQARRKQTFDRFEQSNDPASLPLVPAISISVQTEPDSYDERLLQAGQVADSLAQTDSFAEARATWTANTQRRYFNDLKLFSLYLEAAHVHRPAEALFNDAQAWRGMTFGLLKGFKTWLEREGYATSTIKGCLSTIHVFCRLAGPAPAGADVLDDTTLAAILTIGGVSGRKARNLDEERAHRQIPTRRGRKKVEPTSLTTTQALSLKKVTTHPQRPRTREHDQLLAARDALLMGLLVEHALRCGEVALLTVDSIDLRRGVIKIYRPKTHRTDIQKMHRHTRLAAEVYLSKIGRDHGPLFTGYDSTKPLSTRAINKRVGVLGGELGIARLSPHDLRHHWTFDALLNNTPLNIVQADGGWETEAMPLRYARQFGATGGEATITESDIDDL
ncbi:MAG TPA: site-specific integrase [Ktedonobacteraceae bacterium]|nr:site-specific integrase [Ktedonobacteraceae bacterium]